MAIVSLAAGCSTLIGLGDFEDQAGGAGASSGGMGGAGGADSGLGGASGSSGSGAAGSGGVAGQDGGDAGPSLTCLAATATTPVEVHSFATATVGSNELLAFPNASGNSALLMFRVPGAVQISEVDKSGKLGGTGTDNGFVPFLAESGQPSLWTTYGDDSGVATKKSFNLSSGLALDSSTPLKVQADCTANSRYEFIAGTKGTYYALSCEGSGFKRIVAAKEGDASPVTVVESSDDTTVQLQGLGVDDSGGTPAYLIAAGEQLSGTMTYYLSSEGWSPKVLTPKGGEVGFGHLGAFQAPAGGFVVIMASAEAGLKNFKLLTGVVKNSADFDSLTPLPFPVVGIPVLNELHATPALLFGTYISADPKDPSLKLMAFSATTGAFLGLQDLYTPKANETVIAADFVKLDELADYAVIYVVRSDTNTEKIFFRRFTCQY